MTDKPLDELSELSDAELRDEVERCHRARQAARAAYLVAVRDLDSRPDAVAGADPGTVATTFLRRRLRVSAATAAADVRAAHALARPRENEAERPPGAAQ